MQEMLLWSYKEDIKQISSGSTENNNLLVVFASIESKFENWPNHYGLK